MPPDDLCTQQRDWLSEAYAGLFPIAAAITGNPKIAEDVTSIAVVAALMQVDAGMCRAHTKPQLFAYIRKIVRNKAKTAIGAGADRMKRRSLCRGDVFADLHAENICRKCAPDLPADEFMEDAFLEKSFSKSRRDQT
jgi:DNA-directed RNA polymerase specialized sigma24 family protein